MHVAGGILLAIAFLAFISDPKGWLTAVGILVLYAIVGVAGLAMIAWVLSVVFN